MLEVALLQNQSQSRLELGDKMGLRNDPNYDSTGDLKVATQPATQITPSSTSTKMADLQAGAGVGGALGGGVGAALGAYQGAEAAAGDMSVANAAYAQALEEANALGVPELEKMQFIGERQAALLKEIEAGPSRMEGVSTDPEFLRAQMEVLQGLKEQGRTGLTAEDKAAFNELRRKNLRDQQAQQQAILANAQMTGTGGASVNSGVSLALQQAAQQQGAEEQAAASDRLSSLAAQRAAQAKAQYGTMAGSMREQEFGEKSKIAQAADISKQYDVSNARQVQQFNVANEIAKNQRDAEALRDTQRYNIGTLPQAQFNMASNKSSQLQSALQKRGEQKLAQGAATVQGATAMNQGIGGALGMAGGAAAAMSDVKLKVGIKNADKDVENFLDNLKALKYDYKEPEVDGPGEHYSPMAQDLEKSKPGKAMVEETPRGKQVDYAKGFGTMTASLANLNKRLRALEKK